MNSIVKKYLFELNFVVSAGIFVLDVATAQTMFHAMIKCLAIWLSFIMITKSRILTTLSVIYAYILN